MSNSEIAEPDMRPSEMAPVFPYYNTSMYYLTRKNKPHLTA